MRIMTFNIQHCLDFVKNEINIDRFACEIKSFDADIIGLNEVRGAGERADYTDQLGELAKKLGMNYYFGKAIEFNGCNPYGNGLLTKYPIKTVRTVKIPDPAEKLPGGHGYETRCVIKATVIAPDGDLSVLITHFGLNSDEQANAVETVTDHITDKRCVLMGDLNVTPECRLLNPIRKRMFDTAALFDTPMMSFPSDKPDRKIDYIFVSNDMRPVFADIPVRIVSDHRPYIVDFEVK